MLLPLILTIFARVVGDEAAEFLDGHGNGDGRCQVPLEHDGGVRPRAQCGGRGGGVPGVGADAKLDDRFRPICLASIRARSARRSMVSGCSPAWTSSTAEAGRDRLLVEAGWEIWPSRLRICSGAAGGGALSQSAQRTTNFLAPYGPRGLPPGTSSARARPAS